MKITLEFNEEERNGMLYAIHGIDFLLALEDLDNKLRAMEKYENQETVEIDKVREMIREYMEDHSVSFNMFE